MKQENVKNKKENREELVSYIRMGRELSGRQQILLVIQLSLPAIMAQLTSVAMQYIDASMVGRLGSGAAAAIGLVASTTWLFGGVCNSFSVGFAVQAAQLIGANKLEAARDVLKQALFTISCISVFLAAIGIAISSFLPGWLGGEKAILKDAGHYFLIYVCFLPCSGLNVLAGRCSTWHGCIGADHCEYHAVFCLREKSDPAYPEGRRISSFGGMSEKGDHFIAPGDI